MKVIGPRQVLRDPGGDWARIREVSDSGAVLVRPDHHVGWRAMSFDENSEKALRQAVDTIFSRGDVARRVAAE